MSRPERVAEQRVLTEVSPSETTHTRLIAEKPKGSVRERLVLEQKTYPKPELVEKTRIIIEPKGDFVSSMLQEILKGRPPTTPQITEALNRAATFLEHRPRPVTSTQQQVLVNTAEFLRSLAMFLERKNQGDHLQKFVYYIVLIGKETQELAALKIKQLKRHPEEMKEKVKELGEKAMERIRPLGVAFFRILSLSFFNRKFHMLLLEIITLLQTIFIDFSKKKESKMEEHKESPTPTPTPTVTTVTTTTPGLAKVIYKTVPVPAQPWVVQEPIEGSKLSKVVTPKEGEAPTGQKTIYRPPIITYYQQTFTSTDEGEKHDPRADEGPQESSPSSPPSRVGTKITYKSSTEGTEKTKYVSSRETISQSPKARETASDKTKLLAQKMVQLLRGLAEDPKYQEGVTTLLELMDEISNYLKETVVKSEKKAKEYTTLQKAVKEARIFLEQFTPDRTLKPTVKDFWRVFDDFQNDNRFKEWSCDLRDFIELMLKRPQELDEEIAYVRAKDFVECGRTLFKDYQHREDVKRILLDLRSLIEGIRADPDVILVQEKARLLIDDFFYTDKKGKRRFNSKLLFDMRTVLIPLILDQMQHVPLPTIEVDRRDMTYRLEDIYFDMTEILPENVFITTSTTANVNLRELGFTLPVTSVTVHIKYIKAKIRKVRFWFKRKRVPKIEDRGTLDVKLGGNGAELLIAFEVRNVFGEAAAPQFHVSNIDFRIDKINIRFHDDVKYRRMYTMGIKLGKKQIKKTIEHQFEAKLRENATKFENIINGVLGQIPRIPLLTKRRKKEEFKAESIPERLKIAKEKAIAAFEDARVKGEEKRLKHLAKQQRLQKERMMLTEKETKSSYVTETPSTTKGKPLIKSQEYEIPGGGKVIYEMK